MTNQPLIKYGKPVIFVLIMLAVVLTANADMTGCCCKDNQAYRGSFVRESVCTSEAPDYNFVVPPSDFVIGRATSTICNEYCRETAEAPEVTISECGSEGYTPKPENIQLKPIKGQRKLVLAWLNNCTDYITHYEISRCQGDCAREDFTIQTTATNFTDQSGLEWGKSYTYKLKTFFSFGGQSDEASITNSPGDLECQSQGTNSFCISPFYYLGLKEYLTTYGYKGTDKRLFETNFNQTRDTNFGINYNNAFRCDDYNRLTQILTCTSDKACIAGATTATCADKVNCKEQASATPFGLYSTLDSCEGTQPKKYCYYDKSYSLVNDCFNCDPAIICYDYRTKASCERDNCGAGSCEWHDIYPALGIGVCVDTRFDNCELCDQKGNFNVEAYNDIFDKCTLTKAKALETDGHPCFYNPSDSSSSGCSAISCLDYSSADQCAAPSQGIQLNQNNNITQKSNDPCGIGVCQYDTTTQTCAKNANGQIDGTVFMDCYFHYSSGNYKTSVAVKRCELDYFPPKTEFIPVSQKIGIVNYFNIRVLDKKNFAEDYSYITKAERQSYPTYFCVYSGIHPCTNLNLSTVSDKLIVDNLILGEKLTRDVTTIAILTEGQNTIRYYTKDPNENLETVKEIRFNACNGCQGPTLIDYNFSNAREVDGVYYTKMPTPSIDLLFSTETTLTTKEIVGMNRIIGTTSQTLNKKFHTVTAASPLLEGNYKLRVDGVNFRNIAMDAPAELSFVYDASAPTVRILIEDQPAGGKIFEKPNVRLKLEFSEATTLEEVTLVKPDIGDYAILGDSENLTLTLTTSDNAAYSGALNLPDGPNQIKVHAIDYAGNHLFDATTFNIFTATPSIILKSPSYGVSATPNFNLVVETSNPATCRFWFNAETPTIPAPATYDLLEAFTTTGELTHSKEGINRIAADKERQLYPLAVKCQSKYGPISKEFRIMFDTTLPNITGVIAYPNPVIQFPYETRLKVTTTPLTFCKYDREEKPFAQMSGTFPGYAKTGQTNHEQLLVLENLGDYTYHISCITLAELGPATGKITFSVKAGVPFDITSKTPGYTETTVIPISLETNKDAICYYSTTSGTIGNLIGEGTGTISHSVSVTGNTGKNIYYITCTTTGRAVINGTPESKKLNITVYAVELPPDMEQNKTLMMAGQCSNGFMDGDETATDCGGSCPKCSEGEQCLTDSDCMPSFSCTQHPQAGFKICAGTELLRTFEKLTDSDNDGLPDWWEEKYFGNKTAANPDDDPDKDGLTNLEEYRYYEKTGHEISPINRDSDGDGWSDGKEIAKGSNPLDINIHPPSLWWLWLIIILLLLILFSTTAYISYNIFEHKKEKKEQEKQQLAKKEEQKRQIGKSREKIAGEAAKIKAALTPPKEDYPLVTELKGIRAEKKLEADIFKRLQNFLEGKPTEKLENGKAIEELRKLKQGGEAIKEPFETLIKLAVDRYPKEERMALLKKLKLLKAGLLSDEEREELFRKLREMAKYWKTHKELLRKEIEKWLKSKPFRFIKSGVSQ